VKTKPGKNTVSTMLQNAVRLHLGGDLDKADRLYTTILKTNPTDGNVLNLKGVIAASRGRHDEAIALFDRAIAILPAFADVHFNKANTLAAVGRGDEALAAYAQAIALKPAYAEARLNAGILLQKRGRMDAAIDAFRDMARKCPNDARGHYNLASCLVEFGGTDESVEADAAAEISAAFERACTLDPRDADAHFTYAAFLARQGDHKRAVHHARLAASLRPEWPEALSNVGEFLRKDGRYAEAAAVHRQALTLRPDDATIKYNLATALYDAKDLDDAERIFQEVIAARKDFAAPYVNLGNIYKDRDQLDKALALFEEALGIDPTLHEAYSNIGAVFADKGWLGTALLIHDKAISLTGGSPATRFNRGVLILALGRLSEGWREYEHRFHAPKERNRPRQTPPNYWRGEDLSGKSILIWTEQGLGDEVLYASMIAEVIARARHCVIECAPRLVPVFTRTFPRATVVGWKTSDVAVTPAAGIDYQLPIASLGQYFRPDFASFPSHAGYLMADRAAVGNLRTHYEKLAGGRRIVGLSWRSKNERAGEYKSMALPDLAPVLQVPDIFFVNLQYGDCDAELAAAREQLGVDIFQDPAVDPLTDMDLFFAQVAAMDLVITTSNTTAHVAGAQNIPAWVMLPATKGLMWYWFNKRTDSPWYPSARLIRQTKFDPVPPWWHHIIRDAAQSLSTWVGQSTRRDI